MTLPHAYAWSLVAFMVQGAVLGATLWAALWLLRDTKPSRRYAVCAVGLIAMTACWLLTFAALLHGNRASPAGILEPVSRLSAAPTVEPVAARLVPALDSVLTAPAWLSGCLSILLLARVGAGLGAAWLLVRRAQTDDSSDLPLRARHIAGAMHVRSRFRVLTSNRVPAPVVVGWLRPAILLPPDLTATLEPDQLDAVLAHELAHLQRHDFLANTLQALVALLFLHPCVWWVSRRMQEEREHCCDDRAVLAMGSPLTYAKALTALEQRRSPANLHLTLGISRGSLAMRIRRLLQQQPSVTATGRFALLSGAGVIVLSSLAALSLSTAQQIRAQAPTKTETSTAAAARWARRPDMSCTFYPTHRVVPYVGSHGMCILDSSVRDRYACRQDAAPHTVESQVGCQWKVELLQRWLRAHPGSR